MIFGMTTYTFVHVVLSVVGIVSGLVVVFGLFAAMRLDAWTALFLVTSTATSATGFVLPSFHLLLSHVVGIVSLVILAVAVVARYAGHLAGAWRAIYAVSAVFALYLNVAVLIVQLFRRVPALHAMAHRVEPPFLLTHLFVLVLFVVLAAVAAKTFRPEPVI